MMTSSEKCRELLESGGQTLSKIREYLDLKITEETENLVNAPLDDVPRLQGRIKAFRDFKTDLTPVVEEHESLNPYN
ncbi:hypothetical protein [Maridesulfovibrio bastinii]|uniref:hypothetical protein n=1 Tax=Maridesulfovibrio bastinii TaxID=47157 RepID=UPI00040FDCC3|nr:hypothetical protein [Maridesulfovibrio bastinii]